MERPDEKLAALRGDRRTHRARTLARRAPADARTSCKATSVLAIPIDEASAKVRTGPPLDDEEDYALRAWAGVIPAGERQLGAPVPDPRLRAEIAAPAYVTRLRACRAGRDRAGMRRRPSRARRAAARSAARARPGCTEQQAAAARDHAELASAADCVRPSASCRPSPRAPSMRARRDARRAACRRRAPRAPDVRVQRAHDPLELARRREPGRADGPRGRSSRHRWPRPRPAR